jgi:large subunit ribosomal protein L4e
MSRAQVNVYNAKTGEVSGTVALPSVFTAPIRSDVVHFVHTLMAKNQRQPYAVNPDAGMQHSAASWGTGRAVSRIPRIAGSGTHRSGQGAFGNMCRQGRMFAPTKIWRKWHRKISVNQRRYATVSALAATAVPALVMARGHKVEAVPEIPLVLSGLGEVTKTAEITAVLEKVGAWADVEKVKDSKKLRPGKGKMRNRRYVQRRGPLVCHFGEDKAALAFRNLPGVETCHVDRLNLLQLAPGGHLGRFVIWTEAAFNRLSALYGENGQKSELKTGYTLPTSGISNADIARIINSAEVQAVLRAKQTPAKKNSRIKKNPLKNLGAMVKLNPRTIKARREELSASAKKAAPSKQNKQARKTASKKFYAGLVQDDFAFGSHA